MDKETKEVVKRIAQIQLEALNHIKSNMEFTDHNLLMKLLQVSEDDLVISLENHIQLYKDMVDMPQIIKTLNEYQLYICSHILWKMEEEWITDYSQGVLGTWAIITSYTNRFHPELTLLKF